MIIQGKGIRIDPDLEEKDMLKCINKLFFKIMPPFIDKNGG